MEGSERLGIWSGGKSGSRWKAGGTPHTNNGIERAKKMIQKYG
jgi:hypothetical protein